MKARSLLYYKVVRMLAILGLLPKPRASNARNLRTDDAALIDLRGPLTVVGIVLGVVITFLIIARLLPTFADSVADVNENLTDPNVTFGDETTDGIKPVFAIVIGIVALLGLVALMLRAFNNGLN